MSRSYIRHKKGYEYLNYDNYVNDVVLIKKDNMCRVMTYNVHGFRDFYGKNKYNEIIQTITMINPDILVLEEITLYTYANVCTELQLRSDLEKCDLFFSGFSSCGINAVFSKYPFTAKEIDLGCDSIKKVARNALICTFLSHDISSNENIVLVGTHLDVYDESGKLRIIQMKTILDVLSINTDIDNDKIILTGDFNSLRKDDYTGNEWAYLSQLDKQRKVITVQDAVSMIESAQFIDSFVGCNDFVKTSVWSGRRVDYIFGKNVTFDQTATYKVTHSDHYPVYADIFI